MADIFISYKREDQEEMGRVRPIAEALTAEGYDVFYDVHVPPGSSWETVLQSKINAARAVIVLWSQHSVASDWVKEEAEMAKHAGKLIPVFLDPVSPPFGFARIEGANLAGWDGDLQNIEWRNLVAAVKAMIGTGEKAPSPGVTRVAYQSSKSVTVTKSRGSGGGVMKWLGALAAVAVIGVGAFWAYSTYQLAEIERGRDLDRSVDELMDRGLDKRDFEAAQAADTIAAYERYLTIRVDGVYRDEAVDRIAELRAAAASTPASPPAPPQPGNFSIAAVTLGGSGVETGGNIRARVTVENSGETALSDEGVFTDFVLSRDTTAPIRMRGFSATWSEDALLRGGRSSDVPPLRPGDSHSWTETVTLPEGWPAGRFNVCVIVDSGSAVSEGNEADNVACAPITVR
ncbi:MAG: TIR domain-containing protein [Pseudomonadota bacterium]